MTRDDSMRKRLGYFALVFLAPLAGAVALVVIYDVMIFLDAVLRHSSQ